MALFPPNPSPDTEVVEPTWPDIGETPADAVSESRAEAEMSLVAATVCVPWTVDGITKGTLKVPSVLVATVATVTVSSVMVAFSPTVKPVPLTLTESRVWTELGVSVIIGVTVKEEFAVLPTVAEMVYVPPGTVGTVEDIEKLPPTLVAKVTG